MPRFNNHGCITCYSSGHAVLKPCRHCCSGTIFGRPEKNEMADAKIGKTGVARRSARTFESDIDIRQAEQNSSDSGTSYNRKRSDLEHSQERERLVEKARRTRTSSTSSTSATAMSDDIKDILGGLDKMAHEKDGEETKISQIEVVKQAKPKTPGRPRNFGTVAPGIYRSGYPETEDHDFLKDLGLRTIVTLVDKEFPEGYKSFMHSTGINHICITMEGTKKADIPEHVMNQILDTVLNPQNHPLLVHCNQGRHRTGCTVAAVRKVMGWPVDSIITEYSTYAEPKIREGDLKYIQGFQAQNHVDLEATQLQRLTVSTAPKPRQVAKSEKMYRMVCATLAIMAVFMMTYLHGRLTHST